MRPDPDTGALVKALAESAERLGHAVLIIAIPVGLDLPADAEGRVRAPVHMGGSEAMLDLFGDRVRDALGLQTDPPGGDA